MQCSVCQHDMVPSKIGLLCPNCGHFEPAAAAADAPPAVTPARITLGSATQAAAQPAAPPAEPTAEPVVVIPTSTPDPEPALEPAKPPRLVINPPEHDPEPQSTPEPEPPAEPAPAIGLKLPTDPLPPAPTATPTGSVIPGLPTDTKVVQASSPKKKWLVPLIAVVAVLVLGGGALAYKAFIFDAQQAPAAYLQKLFSAKTGQFSAIASYSSPQDSSSLITGAVALTADGSYDVTSPQTPKSDIKLAIKYSGSSLGGEIITLPKTAYFRITQLGFLSSLGLSLSNAWYKYPITSESSNSGSDCSAPHSKSGSLFGLSFPNSLPLQHASRVGLFATIDGHRTTHFTGDVDMSKLQSYVDAANAQLPADCKITLDASTVKNTTVHYDIWRGSDFDRASFTVVSGSPKSTINLTLDSQGYNKPVSIQAPANAQSLDSLLSSFDASTSNLDGSGVGNINAGTTPSSD